MGKTPMWLQYKRAGDDSYREGIDKHSMKRDGRYRQSPLIFSYESLLIMLALSDNFCNWLKTKPYNIRMVKDITPEHWNEFLEDKSEVAGKSSLDRYMSNIRKWERILNRFYGLDLQWDAELKLPELLDKEAFQIKRSQQMQREDLARILIHATRPGTRSKAPNAWELSARFGLRVEGAFLITADNVHLDTPGHWGFGTVDITEKGGRNRVIDIKSENDRDFVARLISGKTPDEPLIGIKKGSINRQLTRIMNDLGIKCRYEQTATHSIRKLYAQETWDNFRNQGYAWEEALRYVNRQLGHGAERDKKLLGVYVKNMW